MNREDLRPSALRALEWAERHGRWEPLAHDIRVARWWCEQRGKGGQHAGTPVGAGWPPEHVDYLAEQCRAHGVDPDAPEDVTRGDGDATEDTMTVFDNATFYSLDPDAETLSRDSAIDALAEHAPVRCPVTVYAWRRMPGPDEAWVSATAAMLVDHLRELWDDEFGGPDDSDVPHACETMVHGAVRRMADTTKVWRCECVAERTYTDDEVRAMGIEVEP